LAYLVSGDDSAPSAGSEYKPIPRFDVQASAGRGRIVGRDQVEEIGPIMALREDYLRKIGLSPAQAHIVTASGASMEPTIRDGDLLVIDRRRQRVADRPASTAPPIFVVTWNDAVLVKRVARVKGGGVLLQSDNPAYPSELVQPDELGALSIEGQVRWITRMT
jgi:phage repressor protein C with HTH and peptisase S24 domain